MFLNRSSTAVRNTTIWSPGIFSTNTQFSADHEVFQVLYFHSTTHTYISVHVFGSGNAYWFLLKHIPGVLLIHWKCVVCIAGSFAYSVMNYQYLCVNSHVCHAESMTEKACATISSRIHTFLVFLWHKSKQQNPFSWSKEISARSEVANRTITHISRKCL